MYIEVEKNLLVQLKTQLDNILKDSGKKKSKKQNYSILKIKRNILDEKKRLILDFIEKHPGTTKEQVIRDLGRYSRVPISNGIKELANDGLIIIENDKKNSHTLRIYINNESSITSLISNLNDFSKKYLTLLEKSISVINKLDEEYLKQLSSNHRKTVQSFRSELFNAQFIPYKWFLMYTIVSDLYFRHKAIYNENTLNEFNRINNEYLMSIYNNMYNRLGYYKDPGGIFFFTELVWKNTPNFTDHIRDFLVTFDNINLNIYAELLLDSIWKIMYPIIDLLDSIYRTPLSEKITDWRQVIDTYYHKDYKPRIKIPNLS